MCGIAGCIMTKSGRKVDERILSRMSEAIAERGPDGKGSCVIGNGKIGLAHRRLAIVDLSAEAGQPMYNNDKTIYIVFNGEIYNQAELREEICKVSSDIKWKTDHADTEVILHAYEVWGMKCVTRLRGMFAFALWDDRKKKLWLVRDRLGIKPLYYGLLDGKINFASNVRALLEDHEQDRTVDKEAVYDFLSLLAVPAPKTLFRNIKKVPAGNYIEVSADGHLKTGCYWDVSRYVTARNLKGNESWIREKLLEKLKEAIRIRKMSDVPIGAFLSGGVDSSTILALFSEAEGGVNTYTAGYKGARAYKNENPDAQKMAEYCKAVHHDTILKEQDILNAVNVLKKLSDDPVADPVLVTQYYITRVVGGDGIKVMQSGEGADELFAGYEHWRKQAQYEKLNHIVPLPIKKIVYKTLTFSGKRISENTEELLRRASQGEALFWGSGSVYISETRKRMLFRKEFLDDVGTHTVWDNFSEIHDKCRTVIRKNPVNWMACVNFVFRIPDLLLARTDRASMENSVETRVPFLDHELVEWGLRIPQIYKIRKKEHKHILKSAVRGVIPDQIIDKKKDGFGLPFMAWYRRRLGRLIRENVQYFAGRSGYFEEAEIEKFLKDKNSSCFAIWALFILSLWWQQYVEDNKAIE